MCQMCGLGILRGGLGVVYLAENVEDCNCSRVWCRLAIRST